MFGWDSLCFEPMTMINVHLRDKWMVRFRGRVALAVKLIDSKGIESREGFKLKGEMGNFQDLH